MNKISEKKYVAVKLKRGMSTESAPRRYLGFEVHILSTSSQVSDVGIN